MTPPLPTPPSTVAASPTSRAPRPRRRSATSLFTDREREILAHLATGASIGAIAAALGVTRSTVTTFRAALREKTGCADTAALAAWARLARRPPSGGPTAAPT